MSTALDDRIEKLEAELSRLRAERDGDQGASTTRAMNRILGARLVLENLPDVVTITDRSFTLLYVNRPVAGRSPESVIGTNLLDNMPGEQRARFMETHERAWSTGAAQTIALATNSGLRWEGRLVPVRDSGQVVFMITMSLDVTERERAVEALRQSESSLRLAIESTGMGTYVSDFVSGKIRWDEKLCRIFGIEVKDGPESSRAVLELVHPDDREHVARAIEQHKTTGVCDDVHHRLVRPDGEVRHVLAKSTTIRDAHGVVTGVRGGVFDVTERKLLEERLQHAQKMDAVGQLTAGIAHNFNNVLGIILPNVALCRQDADPETRSHLDDIEHAANRAAEMVRQLLLFARPDRGDAKVATDLVAVCRRTVEMCRTMFSRSITIDFDAEPDLPAVLGNAGQLEQVLLNICLNARDAFDQARSPQPRLTIRLACSVREGRRSIVIQARDNGPGMEETTRKRIFEPFFTTKEVGRGTGLGMASAYAIVRDHGGEIQCEGRPGHGAAFFIELPAADVPVAPVRAADGAPEAGSGLVLLVDDEPLVRRAVRAILERGGYRVLEAADGIEGLAICDEQAEAIDVIVLDQSMPRLTGDQVMLRLSAKGSRTPVVLLSGNPDPDSSSKATAVLHKPASASVVLQTIRRVIQDRSSR